MKNCVEYVGKLHENWAHDVTLGVPTYPHIRIFLVFFFSNLFFYLSRRDPSVIKIVRLKLIE